tara:strand:+ start:427 stop:735 length:309 start_codon:yes stop_codon:yes gene_type:complete
MKATSLKCRLIGVLPLLCYSKGHCAGAGLITKLKGESQHNILLTIGETMEIQVKKSDGTVVTLRIETIARHLAKQLNETEIPDPVLTNIIYDEIEELVNKNG